MKRYLWLMGGMIAFFLLLFGIAEGLGIPLLTDPTPWLSHRGALAASVGVGLLVADVLLPVPSSLVMVAHGALFGVTAGTLLSLAVIVTRPVPLVAETVAIIAGTSPLGWGRVTLAALAGSLPPALLYAISGAAIADFQSTSLVFGGVLLIAGLSWMVGRWAEPFFASRESEN